MTNKLIIAIILLNLCSIGFAQETRKKIITRVFWQDRETNKLSYADLSTTDRWHIQRGWVKNFPSSSSEQKLGPIQQIGKVVSVAISDGDENKLVRINTGVVEEPHGNHFHWKYTGVPSTDLIVPVNSSSERVVVQGQNFFFPLSEGGFIRLSSVAPAQSQPATSFKGGSANSAFAVTDRAAYLNFENENRLDVVNLVGNSTPNPVEVASTNISSMVVTNGKWFASSQNGIVWANSGTLQNPQPISGSEEIGKNVDELIVEQTWVLFSSSNDGKNSLCLINGQNASPTVLQIPIAASPGLKLSAPKTKLSLGKRFAFLFLERSDSSSDAQEQLIIVELDPNRDRNFQDAKVVKTLNVGASNISGNTGHHGICFDDYGRFAIYSDPGDGMLNIMTLNDFQLRAKFRVNGKPDRIVAVGSPEHFH